jgi:RNA-binding protein
MDATVWIGKQGSTDQLLTQIASQLKTRELVKLKVHKSALEDTDTDVLAARIAASTKSTLVDVMGHTFTLYKKKERAKNPKKS